jgi:hypothetical protein
MASPLLNLSAPSYHGGAAHAGFRENPKKANKRNSPEGMAP